VAGRATLAAGERAALVAVVVDAPQQLGPRVELGDALRADRADQPLRDHADQRRGQTKRLDVHVDQPRHRAGGVVGVQGRQHEVPRQRRLHGHLGRLGVADFAHQNHVGILAEDRTQRRRKAKLHARIDLHLVDQFELVFDRVLDRHDVAVYRFDQLDGGIQRGRLAAARRPGDQQQAVRPGQHRLERAEHVVGHAEQVEVEVHALAVEHAEHGLLAQHGGERGDAEVDLAALDDHVQPAVLRLAMLGDVHLGHHLHARDHGRMQVAPRAQHFAQQPVDAEPHRRMRPARLDVDVAGPLADGLHDQVVDEIDDGAAVGQCVDLAQVDVDGVDLQFDGVVGKIGRDGVDLEALLVHAADHPLDGRPHGEYRSHGQPGDPLELVDLFQVLRLGHGDGQHAADVEHGQHAIRFGDVPGHDSDHQRIDHAVAQPHHRQSQLPLDERQDLLLVDKAQIDQRFAQAIVRLRLAEQRRFELFLRDQAGADQVIAEPRCARNRRRREVHSVRRRRLRRGGLAFGGGRHCTKLPTADVRSLKISNRFATAVTARISAQSEFGDASLSSPPWCSRASCRSSSFSNPALSMCGTWLRLNTTCDWPARSSGSSSASSCLT
jgi:hypothetical protein